LLGLFHLGLFHLGLFQLLAQRQTYQFEPCVARCSARNLSKGPRVVPLRILSNTVWYCAKGFNW
jgi:hypothetical protein